MSELLTGECHVDATENRTKKNWAECMRLLEDEIYPQSEQIVVVMDNLNTHTEASLYESFESAEAKLIAGNLRFIIRPNMAVG